MRFSEPLSSNLFSMESVLPLYTLVLDSVRSSKCSSSFCTLGCTRGSSFSETGKTKSKFLAGDCSSAFCSTNASSLSLSLKLSTEILGVFSGVLDDSRFFGLNLLYDFSLYSLGFSDSIFTVLGLMENSLRFGVLLFFFLHFLGLDFYSFAINRMEIEELTQSDNCED